uniref:Uncharacterized protein n=1 Tax=Arundo donax TaxID=35708 RepID=A0A0A9BX31_ARUDO
MIQQPCSYVTFRTILFSIGSHTTELNEWQGCT